MKIKNPKKISKPIGEGKFKKGGLNSPPTTPKPPPPKGQGGSIPSDEILQALTEIKKNMEKFYKEYNETIELFHEDFDFIKGRLLGEPHEKI